MSGESHSSLWRLGLLAALLLAGCRPSPPAAWPRWAEPAAPYAAPASGGTSFDALIRLAERTDAKAQEDLTRVRFTESMIDRLLASLDPELRELESAVRTPAEFEYRPVEPGEPAPWRAAWRLLGRCLAWRIERAVAAGEPTQAVNWTLAATRFGGILCGGDAADVSLGYAIQEDARLALLPALATLPAEDLGRLAEGLARAHAALPPPETAATHQDQADRLALQWLQDRVRDGEFEALRRWLGPGGVAALDRLRRSDDAARIALLQAVDKAREERTAWLQSALGTPLLDRAAAPKLEGTGGTLARHVLGQAETLPSLHDRGLAKLRLFALEAGIRQGIAESGAAPEALDQIEPELRIDPMSGRDFIYRASGPDFRIYGVGTDLRDDGGDTDEAGLTPDLALEVPGR